MCILILIVAGSVSNLGPYPCGDLPGHCNYEGYMIVAAARRQGEPESYYRCRPAAGYRRDDDRERGPSGRGY